MKRAMLILAALILLATFAPSAAQASKISIHVDGPLVIGTNQTVRYKVSLQGFFDNYSCGVMVVGYNLTGASPVNEYVKSSVDGKFIFNVTAPATPQTIYIYFNAYGKKNGTENVEKVTRILTVQVKKAMAIKFRLKNVEDYDVKNIRVDFYIDGVNIGNMTVGILKANTTRTFTYLWVPQGLYEGKHTLTIKVSSDGVVLQNSGREYSNEFYYGEQKNYDYVNYVNLSLFLVVLGLFILVFLGRRGRAHAPAPKWKK